MLVDDSNSWFHDYLDQLECEIKSKFGFNTLIVSHQNEIKEGYVCFALSCTSIIKKINLIKNQHNIVVHPSPLPLGRGFSPLAWQILNGENEITFCLLEADENVDQGPIYQKKIVRFSGYELNSEIKKIQAQTTIQMCVEFLDNVKKLKKHDQIGIPSYYKRRTNKDSELNINKTIKDQFNLLRIVDNERYPAFFYIDGHKYNIKIDKE